MYLLHNHATEVYSKVKKIRTLEHTCFCCSLVNDNVPNRPYGKMDPQPPESYVRGFIFSLRFAFPFRLHEAHMLV